MGGVIRVFCVRSFVRVGEGVSVRLFMLVRVHALNTNE